MILERFGFTGTQAKVYVALLRRKSATGYALSRDTGLARANVYQALDGLLAGGLATSHGTRPVEYAALGAAEAVRVLSARRERDLRELAKELGAPARDATEAASDAERLEGADAVVARAVSAADAARHEILAVTGPWAPALAAALERAGARGVPHRVVSLGAPAPEGAAVRDVPTAELTAYWGGLPVALVADRERAVCGVLTAGGGAGLDARNPGLVPFVRHLLRRELATAAAPRVS